MEHGNGHIPLASAKIDNLFVPLDGTEWHEQAIAFSLLFSDWFDAKLNLFFSLADLPPLINRGVWRQRAQLSATNASPTTPPEVSDDDPLLQNGALYEYGKMMAHSYLDEIRERLGHLDISITTDVAAGSPAHILTYKAQTSENSLIVMQARPQAGWMRFIAQKMSESLLTATTVPVLMHSGDRHDSKDYAEFGPDVVLLPVRGEVAASTAMPFALATAQKANAPVRIISATLHNGASNGSERTLRDRLAGQFEDVNVPVEVTESDLPLDDAVASAEVDYRNPWVVMGSRMKRGVTRRVMSSQIDNVRRRVHCPILAVPVPEVLPKRESAIERWLIEWRADRAAIENDQRWWVRRSMQRSVTGALTRIRRSNNGQAPPKDDEPTE